MTTQIADALAERVAAAHHAKTPLAIRGGNTKAFLSQPVDGAILDIAEYRGMIDYQPGELVVTARAGTPLAGIETALAEHNQMLPFEPPHFGAQATLGGTIAAGLSGPRRPYAGAARDFVLGTRILNGRGESLHFGGQVMKNVAGYDLSRLMVGAMGTLGVLLEVSLKVLPRPALEATLVQEIDQAQAIRRMNELAGRPLPLSAAYWEEDRLYLRLSGAGSAVAAAQAKIGGEALDSTNLWQQLRELQTDFLAHATTLWRISLPPATPPLDLPGAAAIDWGGAQRWLAGEADPRIIRAAAESAGGHATLFRGNGQAPRIHPLPDALMGIHRRLKQALDPAGILNPGRLYPDL